MSMREVAVIGVGQSKFGKFPERSFLDLGHEAVLAALRDSGVSPKAVQAAYASRLYVDIITGEALLSGVGIAGIEIMNVENACAGGSTAVRALWKDVATGFCDLGVAVGVESMTTSPVVGKMIPPAPDDIEAHLGMAVPVAFALIARRLMETEGATPEDFARVSVKAHRAGALNPMAQYQKEVTVEEVLRSRMIADPITLLQCCPATDGAAAVVMCSLEVARRYTSRPVKVLASALLSGSYAFAQPDFTSFEVGRRTARQAYELAGLGPEDLDVVECHDAFAPEELVHYEDLGLCEAGGAVALLRSGATELGGRIPVNPSGGLQSLGHPLSASGVRNVCEIALHLRGQAGARQTPGAKVGLAQMLGGAAAGLEAGACCIHILGV
ncbi:MAG: thiolase family protein [Deltaproteobacteria bacterium]|nr:thiolase family protein [Deltaproteobacteria bacterium]